MSKGIRNGKKIIKKTCNKLLYNIKRYKKFLLNLEEEDTTDENRKKYNSPESIKFIWEFVYNLLIQ